MSDLFDTTECPLTEYDLRRFITICLNKIRYGSLPPYGRIKVNWTFRLLIAKRRLYGKFLINISVGFLTSAALAPFYLPGYDKPYLQLMSFMSAVICVAPLVRHFRFKNV